MEESGGAVRTLVSEKEGDGGGELNEHVLAPHVALFTCVIREVRLTCDYTCIKCKHDILDPVELLERLVHVLFYFSSFHTFPTFDYSLFSQKCTRFSVLCLWLTMLPDHIPHSELQNTVGRGWIFALLF